jgi:glutamate--cysteine ligase catalytic subunit
MAQHISHLFIRDPLVLYKENLDDMMNDTDLWENIQSTNWQSMRFKPPPSVDSGSPNIGWRVEFRTTELQVTDFENAAFVAFLVLLTRTILTFNLSLLMPISKVDENMRRAQKRDACLRETFYFRRNVFDKNDTACVEMSLDEIMNGHQTTGDNNNGFPGLVPLIREYLGQLDTIDVGTNCKIMQYLKLIEKKANGSLKTTANWMRSFVMNSPKYAGDSVVSDEVAYDLMTTLNGIGQGTVNASDLNDTSASTSSS